MPDLATLTPDALRELPLEELQKAAAQVIGRQTNIRQEMQIRYYEPASPAAGRIHLSTAGVIGVGGGNRSSKTETCLVESIALATGIFPLKYDAVFREKFRGPLNIRICIESLTSVLHKTLLPKLAWWRWTGIDAPGGPRGHWGWVPKMCLKDGSWDKAWSEKERTLTVLCRDPDDLERVMGESEIQVMSYDQDWEDYASGTFHIVHMDEPPPVMIWRENQARVLDVNGRIFLSMTWPNDPGIAVDWIYDEVYEPGQEGPLKDPEVDWFELETLDNIHLDPDAVRRKTAGWSEEDKKVKLRGQPLRFSNRIHPLFTDLVQHWCFACGGNCAPQDKLCGCERKCEDITSYIHVGEFTVGENWPCVFVIDPHPRKPHMMIWAVVDPADDILVVMEAEVDGDAADVRTRAEEVEESMGLDVRLRLMDPNMGRSPTARRDVNWQDEFDAAGFPLELADNSEVGRKRVNQYLKPDSHTRRPRLLVHSRCRGVATQMKRYVWDEFKKSADRDVKQTPKPKYDDYPACLRYLLNWEPTFRMLYEGAAILSRPGRRKGAY